MKKLGRILAFEVLESYTKGWKMSALAPRLEVTALSGQEDEKISPLERKWEFKCTRINPKWFLPWIAWGFLLES